MSDEPAEAGDSGSDATGASTSSGSGESAGERDDSPEEDADSPKDAPDSSEEDADSPKDDPDSSEDDADSSKDNADSPATDAEDADAEGTGAQGADAEDADARDDESDEAAPDEDAGSGDASHSDDPQEGDGHLALDDDAATPGQPHYSTDRLATPEAGADPADADSGNADPVDAEPGDASSTEDASASDDVPVGAEAPAPDEGEAATTASTGDGETTAPDAESSGSSILSGGIGGSAPPDDEEMPLTEHIEEMLTRLAIVVVVAAFAMLAAFPLANDMIIHMWYDVHYGTVEACKTAPQSGDCVAPHVYGPLELVLTRIRVAGLAGLLVALPLGIYQTYRFMRPGLYPHERRYFLASVPFSLVLGIVGMAFAYFVLLPFLFAYFISYTEGSADLAFQLSETMNLILVMMGMLAIIFQIPLLIMLAVMMGITTRRWLERRRLYFWGLFLGVGVIFGPDPTGMAPVLLTATMVALFEGTLLLLRWTGR